jgi:hypothetical protein
LSEDPRDCDLGGAETKDGSFRAHQHAA